MKKKYVAPESEALHLLIQDVITDTMPLPGINNPGGELGSSDADIVSPFD